MKLSTPDMSTYEVHSLRTMQPGPGSMMFAEAELFRWGAHFPAASVIEGCTLTFDNVAIEGVKVSIRSVEISTASVNNRDATIYDVLLSWPKGTL